MKSLLRILVLLAGLALFGWFVHRAGPGEIWQHVRGLGWLALVVPVPYFAVYLLDTWGWYLAFGSYTDEKPRYRDLFRIRWAGEAVNNVVPSAYIGGEAIKVYLLHKRGIQGLAAGTSVVASKTCQVLAQVLFIGLGAMVAFPHLEAGTGGRLGMGIITGAAFTVVGLLFFIQRHGMFSGLRALLTKLSIRIKAIEKHQDTLRKLDDQVFRFYNRDRKKFFKCTLVYLAGWMADALEIYVVCWLLGLQLTWTEAVAIEAFISVAKAMGIFVPAALGVQESGVVLLFHLFGLPAPIGAAYAILRRGREMIYVLLGGALLYREEGSFKNLTKGKVNP
jgi:putative membrane protein